MGARNSIVDKKNFLVARCNLNYANTLCESLRHAQQARIGQAYLVEREKFEEVEKLVDQALTAAARIWCDQDERLTTALGMSADDVQELAQEVLDDRKEDD